MPEVITYYEGTGIPSFAFGYVPPPPGSQFLRKFNWAVSDNLTKVYKTHTIKTGYYMDQTGNNNVTLGSQVNGNMSFMRWDSCYPDQPPPSSTYTPVQPTSEANLGNTVGNFLIGCPLGGLVCQRRSDSEFASKTFEGYITDEWKVNSKLTLTLGIELRHLGTVSMATGF